MTTTDFYANNINNFRRKLVKKEFSIIKDETNNSFISIRFYKNFNYWSNIKWFNYKEFIRNKILFPLLFLKFLFLEPKNFHIWSFFLNYIFCYHFKSLEKILAVNLILSFDNFNESLWNFNFLLSSKIPLQDFDFFGFFFKKNLNFIYESKFKFFKNVLKNLKFVKSFPLVLYSINYFYFI